MANSFSQLREKMPAEAQARAKKRADTEVKKLLAEMPLNELRQARGLSQVLLASHLGVGQPAVAKLERRTDMYISTLRSHIRAMGGELNITATFPEGEVKISNFADIQEPDEATCNSPQTNDDTLAIS